MKKTMIMLSAGLFTLAVLAFTTKTMDQKPWPVPDAWKNKANPLKGDAASVATGCGEYLFANCRTCNDP